MLLIYAGHSLCFTLYIRMNRSCKRLFSSVGRSAFSNSCSQLELLSLKTALSPLSCSLSNFRVSLALQKCHSRWQYVRNGNRLLNNINLDFIGIRLRSLIRTPILWLAFLQIEIICSEKFSLESNTTPRSMTLYIFRFNYNIIHANIAVKYCLEYPWYGNSNARILLSMIKV